METADERTVMRRKRRTDWQARAPLLLVGIGGAGFVASLLLAGVCDRFVYLEGTQFCLPLLDPAWGTAALGLSALPIALGLYLIFVRRPSYRHTCAECGRVYRDAGLYSERRARGKMVCSDACAAKVEARAEVEELRDTVEALERLAVRAPQGLQRDRARARLQEIADAPAEPGRTQARDALRRIEQG